MGTGKSTVGPIVAAQAKVPFHDLDTTIEQAAGTSIPAIFANAGEPAFRKLEADTLRRLLVDPTPTVIALGGGTLVDPDLRAEVLTRTSIVNLVAHPDTIAERVGASSRPLLAGAANPKVRIRELLTARAHAYAHAHALIRTDDRSPDDIAHAVLLAWANQTLLVQTASLTYPATLTRNAPHTLTELVRTLDPSSTFVVTDQNVASLHTEPFLDALRSLPHPFKGQVVLTPGEVHKQWPAVQQILEAAVEAGADRNSLLIAIGGGVVSDITGFAAAVLLRGVRWVAVPTTMLSMVDAAVGGKTAVDLGLAKNAVGAFHQPSGVIIDPRFTHTETSRAYTSGLAEVIKSGAIADPELLHLMLDHPTSVLSRDINTIEQLVLRALRVKTTIVSRDERESGERMLLNFGHTIGHGLEAAGNYAQLTHGEAVALGTGLLFGLVPAGHTVHGLGIFDTLADVFYLVIIAFVAALAAANIAASRHMMVVLAPKERLSEFFGLFALSSTATVWIGPLLIEVFTNASKDQRIGFSPVLILLGVGLALMFTLKKTTGAKGQIEPASPPAA